MEGREGGDDEAAQRQGEVAGVVGVRAARCGDGGRGEAKKGQGESEEGGEPREGAARVARHDGTEHGEGGDPEGVAKHLDTLAHVEERAVAGEEVAHDDEVDEGVVAHPAGPPGHRGPQHHGAEGEGALHGGESHGVSARSGGWPARRRGTR